MSTRLAVAGTWRLRAPERPLLALCWVCISLGFLMLWGSTASSSGGVGASAWVPLGVYGVILATTHLVLVLTGSRADPLIVVAVSFLAGFGMLAQDRLGLFEHADGFDLNLMLFPLGVSVMLLVVGLLQRGRYQRLAAPWIHWAAAGVSIVVLAGLLLVGERYRGGVYGFGLITPAELLKVTLLVFVAGYVERHARALSGAGRGRDGSVWAALGPLIGVWVVVAGLLAILRDVGLFLVLSVGMLGVLVARTGRLRYLLIAAIGAAGALAAVLQWMPHGQRRIQAWLDPFGDPTGGSWQVLQALSGMYAGGLWGEGFGRGNPEYTPIAQSDFIYAVVGEELGLVGATIVVVFFLALFGRGLAVAARSARGYGRAMAVGVVSILCAQTLLNLGGVTKAIPVTGIALPFVSQGGSSLTVAFVLVGLLLAISDGDPATSRTQGRRTGARISRTLATRSTHNPRSGS